MLTKIFGKGFSQLDPAQAKSKLDTKPAPFLLDVREPEEFRDAHIAGARLIPLGDLPQRAKELPRDQEIICVCQSGSRSASAVQFLASAGYTAINLNGGMINWVRAGLPVQKGAP
jgi:rhodanese-related sulfurtransferase